MNNPGHFEKLGATPGKLALIAVLSIVLIVVVVQQFPGRGSMQTPASSSKATVQSKAVDNSSVPDTGKQTNISEKASRPWPQPDLPSLVTSDPFVIPDWAKENRVSNVAQQPARLQELQEQGASIVVIAAEEKSARIGEQRVSVGDVVEGYRITDITTRGVILNKLEAN